MQAVRSDSFQAHQHGRKQVKKLLTLLFAILSFAVPISAQTPVAVTNSSFELPATTAYTYSATGWTSGGNFSAGVFNATGIFPTAPDGLNVAWINSGASLSQDLGTQPAALYTLSFKLGNRPGFGNALTSLVVAFGSCSQTFTLAGIPVGTFTLEAFSCDQMASGDFSVTFTNTGGQVSIDNVVVTSAPIIPPPAPIYKTQTYGAQLVNCVTCDGTDYSALASASIYQGASFSLTQDGQNICAATLNANAQGACSGPVNVQPAMVIFTITVTSPSGAQMFVPFQFAAPGMIVGAAPTGNIKVIIGFDATTSIPRAGQVYSQ